ncbi:MAG: 2-oxoacid:ferredoxin oxidoreductase subunit beta [Alphaproteobacteria bacterium]|nr:2-oxoacid:ferredoxin oxidoreductase subunit beta [Alphaproteobacteria bacterium]
MNVVPERLTAKDFATDQEVRWCPGCGDYAILKSVQKTMADIGARPENTVFVSGIGCAARFPYYMATYGFHTIHGRAPAIATGIKLAKPELDVWVVGGDGDMLSIGGNHLLHVLRRNVDLQVLIFNNEIYGLTKGQYSPTSRVGTRSPSTPQGSVESPVSALAFGLGCGAHFIARSIDTNQKHLPEVLKAAHAYKGAALVEILQNCIVYNDGVFADITENDVADDRQLPLEHGKPMLFGKQSEKGIRLNRQTLALEVVTIGQDGVTMADVLAHDQKNKVLAGMLVAMEPPHLPVALGVIYADEAPTTYERGVVRQMEEAKKQNPVADLNKLLRAGYTWKV